MTLAAPRILVTGASGFIGRHLVAALARAGYQVRAAARQPVVFDGPDVEGLVMGDMSRPIAAEYLVRGCDAVIHAAGMAHARPGIPDAVYTAINVDATRQIAKAARAARVKHVVLMSSVRAQAGATASGILTEDTAPTPTDAYGRSKLAAESAALDALAGSSTRATVLRPVLVYGPGVKGNMAELMRLAERAVPLPFASLTARRSLVGIDNLVGAILHLLSAPDPDGVFLVADDGAVTLADIVAALRRGRGRAPMLLPIPQVAVRAGLRLAKRHALADRLTGSLVVDAARLRATGWRPQLTTTQGLELAARAGPEPLPAAEGTGGH